MSPAMASKRGALGADRGLLRDVLESLHAQIEVTPGEPLADPLLEADARGGRFRGAVPRVLEEGTDGCLRLLPGALGRADGGERTGAALPGVLEARSGDGGAEDGGGSETDDELHGSLLGASPPSRGLSRGTRRPRRPLERIGPRDLSRR